MALILSGDSPSLSGTYQGGAVTSGTAVASTSGTAINFTSIPSWVKKITVMFRGVSTNGTANYLIQIGSGSYTTSGYLGASSGIAASVFTTAFTTGFGIVNAAGSAANTFHGTVVLSLLDSSVNSWTAFGSFARSDAAGTGVTAGSVALAGVLDRIQVTTTATDTFDAGSINILYE
jgi:hypothetical protein